MSIESFADALTQGSLAAPAAFAVAFAGGLVAGFGPCVLPMVPAVFGYVTGHVASSDGQKGGRAPARGLFLAAVFVLGMSLVFTAIGAAAGILGRALIIGAWAYYAAAAICVLIGLQMMEVIRLPLDRVNALLPMAARPERGGVAGTLLFGMLFGLIATPCSTPILAAIATLAASTKSAATGAGLLFVYGLGKGVPLIAIGVASGSLAIMRRASRYMPMFTKLGGAGLVAAALYLVWLA